MTIDPSPSRRPTQILFKSTNDKTIEENASYEELTMCHLEAKSQKLVSILSLSPDILKCQKILQNCKWFSL